MFYFFAIIISIITIIAITQNRGVCNIASPIITIRIAINIAIITDSMTLSLLCKHYLKANNKPDIIAIIPIALE